MRSVDTWGRKHAKREHEETTEPHDHIKGASIQPDEASKDERERGFLRFLSKNAHIGEREYSVRRPSAHPRATLLRLRPVVVRPDEAVAKVRVEREREACLPEPPVGFGKRVHTEEECEEEVEYCRGPAAEGPEVEAMEEEYGWTAHGEEERAHHEALIADADRRGARELVWRKGGVAAALDESVDDLATLSVGQ